MAKFDYNCKSCGITTELDTNEEVVCPECGSTELTKLFVPMTAIYKASGFYSNS